MGMVTCESCYEIPAEVFDDTNTVTDEIGNIEIKKDAATMILKLMPKCLMV